MIRRRKPRSWIVALGALLLVARLGSDHVHLCFDGSEPPATVHGIDSGIHHEEGAGHDDGIEHVDGEVQLPGFTAGKAKSAQADSGFVAPTLWRLVAIRPAAAVRVAEPALPEPTTRPFLRPPTRGPPASHYA
jgi:hypothetical protein